MRILEEAANEAIEAAAWYDSQRAGLGADFERTVDAALDLLEAEIVPLSTFASAAGRPGVKRLMFRRFPYEVVVTEVGAEIVVVAFAHQSRRPGYWRHRLL